MVKHEIQVSIKDFAEFKELIGSLVYFLHQVEISDFKDSLGHELKKNKPFIDFKDSVENFMNK